jgi:acyl-CoA synthetase (NDP forming)
MADRAEDLSLPLPPFTAAEEAVLREKVPYCSTINPVDITGQIVGQPEVLATACRLASDSGRYGGIAVFAAGGPVNAQFWEVMKKSVADLSARPGTTVTCCGIMTEAQKGELMALGSLVYEEPTHAIDAFAVLRRHARAQEAAREVPAAIPTAPALPRAGTLNEAEALAWLAQAGVTPVPHAVAATAEEAAAIAERCAAPVAIKVLSRDLLHKTEAGGVRLGIVGPVAARAAFDAIRADVTRLAPQASFEGVLVARMVKPVLECMAGARFDPVFGPVVAFGLGGTDVEWVKRVAIASAPVTPERVAELLTRMDLPRRLDGWRGGPAIGIDALVAAIAGVGRLAAAAGPRLDSIEVNPLMVTALGVFAADAVVQIR